MKTFMIHDQIKEKIREAMKARDELRLSVMRGLLAAFTNENVAKGKRPDEKLTDEEALAVLKRAANQRKDAANQFRSGNRSDLAEKEEAEFLIISEYLPVQMTVDEIKKIVLEKKTDLNVSDKSKLGVLIGAVMKETKGRADGAQVKQIVEELIS